MNCKDFNEIADSYLSDELAVETNHEIFKHLDYCVSCRKLLAARRRIRESVSASMKKSHEFAMSPLLAARIKNDLRNQTTGEKKRAVWKIAAPVLAGLLIFASVGFLVLYNQNQATDLIQSNLIDMAHKAIGDHRYCAMKKIDYWKASAKSVSAEKPEFVKSLEDEKTHFISAHDCVFDGQSFTHYILRREEKIVSVLKISSEIDFPTNSKVNGSIVCEREDGLQAARFQSGQSVIFVISDMSETENLSIARTLSESLKLQVRI